MAVTSLSIGNEYLATTLHNLMDEWRDGLHRETALLKAQEKAKGAGKPSLPGGTRILFNVALNSHSNTTRFQTGFEQIDLTVADVGVPAVYSWAYTGKPIAISEYEEFVNQGPTAVLNILETRSKQTANEMKREYNQHGLAGNVTNWDDWNTLNGVDHTTGFLEEGAAGAAQTNDVGGINKTTYTSTAGWNNQIFDGAGSYNSNGLHGMYALGVDIKDVAGSSDSHKTKMWIASLAGFKNYKRALQGSERYQTVDALDAGRPAMYFDGVEIMADSFMPTDGNDGGSGQSSTDPVSFYCIDAADIYTMWADDGYFALSGFDRVSGEYDVRSALIRCRGQLVSSLLGTSGIAFDLETF